MKVFKLFSLAFSMFWLVACTTTYTPDIDYNPEYNFDQIKTFVVIDDYVANQQASKQLNRNLSSLDNDRIVKAINSSLSNKGMFAVDKDDADVQVHFQVVTKDKTKLRTYNTGIYNCWRCRGYYGAGMPVQQVEIREYVEGTVIIDMVNPETGKSVWRSLITKPVKPTKDIAEKQKKINEVIQAMLAPFKAPVAIQ